MLFRVFRCSNDPEAACAMYQESTPRSATVAEAALEASLGRSSADDARVHCDAGGLRYVDDTGPGLTRRKLRGKFAYFDAKGRRITDACVIERINALAIPPAYEQVWICPDETGHIQATARDARGRKQYRYHEQWSAVRDASKYQHLLEFSQALPRIRRVVQRDLALTGLKQEKVLAVVVRLLETTLIRVGTREYARANKSFGLTTLRRRHTSLKGGKIRFRFRGKSGVEHDVTVNDRRVATVVKRCMELSGQQLFHYTDDAGQPHLIDSGMVNMYLRAAGRGDFTAKHFRTWFGTVFALRALQAEPWVSTAQAKKKIVEVVKIVSARLGNTPSVCRACYIHPRVLQAYEAGELPARTSCAGPKGLTADERRLVQFLSKAD